MNYGAYITKRKIEDVLLFPFIVLGRVVAMLSPMKRSYKRFFFFPFYHTGGAEKIHAQIAKACGGSDCIIYFTRKSKDDTFLSAFKESGCTIKDISRYTDNKLIYFMNFIHRGIISGYINKQDASPIVFNGHSNFAYKISPWLKKEVAQIDLVHSLNTFSFIRIPFIPFYSKIVLISKVKQQAHLDKYREMAVPEVYLSRFQYIPNAASFPLRNIDEKQYEHLRILFVGRNSPEKRFPLFLSIAEKVHAINDTISFAVIGDVEKEKLQAQYAFINFHGTLNDSNDINNIYWNSHILLLTSETEGFPLVVIEAMANGCAIIATPVGDIPAHVNEQQGYLFSTVEDQQQIINEGVERILGLSQNTSELKAMGAKNITYAQHHFSIEQFNRSYRQLLNVDNQ